MKEAGAYRVFTGVETIDSDSSNKINKNINVKRIKNAIGILQKNGIEVHTSFIIGNPGDTDNTMWSTIEFIKEVNPTIITLNNIRVYPGTDIYNNMESYGLYLEDKYWYEKDEWTKRSICGSNELSASRIDYWIDHIMREFFVGSLIGG